MSNENFETVPVRPGFDWSVQILDPKPVEGNPLFPVEAQYSARVKQRLDGNVLGILATVDSSTGAIIRENDDSLIVLLTGTVTALLESGKIVYVDLIRTDLGSPQHTDIEFTVPVR